MKPIAYCFSNDLKTVALSAMKLEALQMMVRDLLPENLKEECNVIDYNKHVLTLGVSSPEAFSALRFMTTLICNGLRKDKGVYQLASVKLKFLSDMP
jgi:hypothetical protein